MSLFLSSCGLESPSYLSTNRVWYVSLPQFLSMYSSTSCPCILPPILLLGLSPSLILLGLSWFKTTPPLPLSLFRFFSLLSLQICLFPSAPIFRFHTILVFFSLFFVVPFFCTPFFFFCSFVSNNYSWNLFPLFFS